MRYLHLHIMKCITMITLFFLFSSVYVHAGVVSPSGSRTNADIRNIRYELETNKEVTLVSGGTYYLSTNLHPEDGWTINADGATIICEKDLINNYPTAVNYNSLNNFTIRGGTWISPYPDGIMHSFIKLNHAQNLRLYDMTIRAVNCEYHSIELVACKNAVIHGCNISSLGTLRKTSLEEGIQIDVATPSTAPHLEARFCNGAGCQNITIDHCTVSGGRAVCCNVLNLEGAAYKKYKKAKNMHSNITVKNCTLKGITSEGLGVFNTLNAVIKNNKIISHSNRLNDCHSVGCHMALYYKATKKQSKNSKIVISGNKIYGGRQALYIDAHGLGTYGKVTVKKNTFYCKQGKKKAFKYNYVKKMVQSKNKMKNWK